MSGDRRDSIFGVVLWPAIKTYFCISLLGMALFFAHSFVFDDSVGAELRLSELFGIIFGYGFFSLAIGLLIAFPPILLFGGLMNRLAKKHPMFDTWIAYAAIGLVSGAAIMLILDWSISIRPSLFRPALLGALCGVIGSLLFRNFAVET